LEPSLKYEDIYFIFLNINYHLRKSNITFDQLLQNYILNEDIISLGEINLLELRIILEQYLFIYLFIFIGGVCTILFILNHIKRNIFDVDNRHDILKAARYLIEDNSDELIEVRDTNNLDIDIFINRLKTSIGPIRLYSSEEVIEYSAKITEAIFNFRISLRY
jgi:hypothetical protein